MQNIDTNWVVRLIVADDASTDKTLEIIKNQETTLPFPTTYLPKQENLGISLNYKRGFAACTGDYVVTLEGDDYWCSPNHIKKHTDFLEDHLECSMSVNQYINYYSYNNCFSPTYTKIANEHSFQYINFNTLCGSNYIGNFSSCVFRNKCLQKINPDIYNLPLPYIDDWLVGLEMTLHGLIAKHAFHTTIYRRNEQAVWSTLDKSQELDLILKRINVYNTFYGNDVIFNIHRKRVVQEYLDEDERCVIRQMSPIQRKIHKVKNKLQKKIDRIKTYCKKPS